MLMFTFPSPATACSAKIIRMDFEPREADAGKPVQIVSTIEFRVSGLDRSWRGIAPSLRPNCDFLVENAIVPDPQLLSLPLAIKQEETQCCSGNDNFKGKYINVECGVTEQLGCTETTQISNTVLAPSTGFCDRCSLKSGNPSCSVSPDFYYRGDAWYSISTGVYKGCFFDLQAKGEQQQIYDREISTIFVSKPSGGNGNGNGGQECQGFWKCQIDKLPVTWGDAVIFGVLAIGSVGLIIYVGRRKKR